MQKLELKSYLEERDIYILNGKINRTKEQKIKNIFNQIENIVLFHNRMGEYKENLLPRIGAAIGREIDNYNSQIILIGKYIKSIENKSNLNSIDFYLIRNGEMLLNRGRKALSHVYSNNYRKLIYRSMKNYEVCLSRVDENNLVVEDNNKIFIGTIKYLTYNLKEHDIYSYIKKIKRKDMEFSIEEVIDYYIEIANLESDSKQYLRALCSYPNEEFKVLERYILKKIDTNEDGILELLYKAKNMDSKCLII
ncbi:MULTISPECIES: hypothetical protein [unclassified Clostridium]|uniref:hypothetical protein n=1 Tax=unclassified Clostridium TaxID=2614128 RepID=UPI0018980752|nr:MULTISPECIES: hypothetical protein [unclassified Clostridium]MCR1951726.1 hypothetical protein [Clostridium sp. DSM 100503]